jgi:hypothetical protein
MRQPLCTIQNGWRVAAVSGATDQIVGCLSRAIVVQVTRTAQPLGGDNPDTVV